jgi:DNA polymerase-1
VAKNWKYREEGKKISKSVIQSKSTEELIQARGFIETLLNLRKLEKLYKTYIKGTSKAIKYNERHKVFMSFNLDGTTTGRLSCTGYSGNEGNNMGISFHTLPRDKEHNIRDMFVAPEGWDFITADYSAMELRVLAHIADEKNMKEAFTQGKDLHTYTASLVFNKAESKVTKQERQIAKAVSFLIVYGGGPFNLSETMDISLRRAEKIIDQYAKVYPGVFKYMSRVNAAIEEDGYITTIFGRRRNLPDVKSNVFKIKNRALRQGLNFTVQSAASDVLVCAVLGIVETLKKRGLEAKFQATVHDSLEFICPKTETREVCDIIKDEMVNCNYMKKNLNLILDIPLSIDLEVGSSFGDGKPYEYTTSN